MGGEVAVYFEPAAVIVVLVLLGQVLELPRAAANERGDPQPAWARADDRANRIEADGTEHDVPLEQVHVGDRLRVRPGSGYRSTASCSRARRRSTNRW